MLLGINPEPKADGRAIAAVAAPHELCGIRPRSRVSWIGCRRVLFWRRMSAFSFRRLRAVLLLVAFGLGLATQAFAAGTTTGPVAPAASMNMAAHATSGMTHCAACGQASRSGTVPSCPAALCWNVVAAPAQVARIERTQVIAFAPLPDAPLHGLAVGPEPHPPRFPTIV